MATYPSENTPVFTPLAQVVGLVCAAVYGVVWRKCQLKDALCDASLTTLGKEIGVDRATALRNIKTLCELGYLIDQTPGLRNVPHTYILGKSVAECNSSIEAQAGNEEDKTVDTRNSSNETVAECNPTVAYNNSLPESVAQSNSQNQTVAESYLKIEDSSLIGINPSKESKRESGGQKTPARPPDMIPVQKIFFEETQKHCLNKAQIKVIQDTVGTDPPALERWRESVRAWNLNGNKPTDAAGMLDWFKTGKRSNYDPNKNGVTNGNPILQRGERETTTATGTSAALGAALLAKSRGGRPGT